MYKYATENEQMPIEAHQNFSPLLLRFTMWMVPGTDNKQMLSMAARMALPLQTNGGSSDTDIRATWPIGRGRFDEDHANMIAREGCADIQMTRNDGMRKRFDAAQ